MFIGTKNEFWLKLLLLNALKNKALIASYFHFLLECTSEDERKAGCLNGGSCFAVDLGERVAACICKEPFTGRRCEFIDPLRLRLTIGQSSGH